MSETVNTKEDTIRKRGGFALEMKPPQVEKGPGIAMAQI